MSHNAPQEGPHAELSERQLRALSLMVSGQSDVRVAEHLGVDRKTLYRWRRQPNFAAALELEREDAAEIDMRRLRAHRGLLLDRFEAALRDERTPPRFILQALQLVLDRTGMGKTQTVAVEGGSKPIQHAHDVRSDVAELLAMRRSGELSDEDLALMTGRRSVDGGE